MKWQKALEIVVKQTKHERFRALCAQSHPDHEYWRADMLKRAAFPSAFEQARNAMAAAGRVVTAVVTGQTVMATAEVHASRWATCTSCVELVDDKCRLCGCYFEAKIALATEKCPIGKW